MSRRQHDLCPHVGRALSAASALLLFLCWTSSAPALAQRSEAEIRDDIEFAKGLAKDWGFVDLATDVITEIERQGVPTRQREHLGVTKCEIYEVAAVNERDRVRRNELFEAALSAYEDFIREGRLSEALPQAESGFVRISAFYARSLEISLEDAVGEEAETLRLRRIDVLTKAVAKTMELINRLKALPEPSERQRAELADLMLNRGSMLLDLGRTQESGQFSFEQAVTILEDVVFFFLEGTPPALRAFDLIGKVYAAQQQWELARDYFEAVVEAAVPSDPEAWRDMVRTLELTQADKERRWVFVELSTQGLVEAYAAMGEPQKACRYALHLYNIQKREGFAYSLQLGYPSLLAAARTLLASGGWVAGDLNTGDARWYPTEEEARASGAARRNRISCTDLALRIADQVNKENKGNVLQVRAQKLIAEVIEQPGVVVDPGVLYEAAEGQYNDGRNEEAIAGFKRVLRALEGKDTVTRLQYGPRIFFRLGRTYQRMERPLEAALAFQEGCTSWLGDPEYDTVNAQRFYSSMQEVARRSPGDQAIAALLSEAENLAARLSTQDRDQINFNLGMRAFRNDDFAEAAQRFSEVQPAGLDYEKALVYIGICKLRTGQTAEAERLLNDYLERYVIDPVTGALGASPARQVRRQEAMAMAEFWRGAIAMRRAERAAKDDAGEAALWERVVELGSGYQLRYPEQIEFGPVTMMHVMEALVALGRTNEARKVYEELAEAYPESRYTAAAALKLHNALRDLRAQASEAGEVDRARQTLKEMAELLEFGNRASASPVFGNLRAESMHWMELSEWTKAEPALQRIVDRFGNEASVRDQMKTVYPDLAHALLELHKVAQAHQILTGLMEDAVERPSRRTVHDYCRAVTGWVEGGAREIKIVPGAGRSTAEFQKATESLQALAGSRDQRYTCEWYANTFQLAYAFYVWATADWSPDKDSKKKDVARGILNTLVVDFGQDFRGAKDLPGIDAVCEEAGGELAEAFGGDRLRSRLVWLWGKVQ